MYIICIVNMNDHNRVQLNMYPLKLSTIVNGCVLYYKT